MFSYSKNFTYSSFFVLSLFLLSPGIRAMEDNNDKICSNLAVQKDSNSEHEKKDKNIRKLFTKNMSNSKKEALEKYAENLLPEEIKAVRKLFTLKLRLIEGKEDLNKNEVGIYFSNEGEEGDHLYCKIYNNSIEVKTGTYYGLSLETYERILKTLKEKQKISKEDQEDLMICLSRGKHVENWDEYYRLWLIQEAVSLKNVLKRDIADELKAVGLFVESNTDYWRINGVISAVAKNKLNAQQIKRVANVLDEHKKYLIPKEVWDVGDVIAAFMEVDYPEFMGRHNQDFKKSYNSFKQNNSLKQMGELVEREYEKIQSDENLKGELQNFLEEHLQKVDKIVKHARNLFCREINLIREIDFETFKYKLEKGKEENTSIIIMDEIGGFRRGELISSLMGIKLDEIDQAIALLLTFNTERIYYNATETQGSRIVSKSVGDTDLVKLYNWLVKEMKKGNYKKLEAFSKIKDEFQWKERPYGYGRDSHLDLLSRIVALKTEDISNPMIVKAALNHPGFEEKLKEIMSCLYSTTEEFILDLNQMEKERFIIAALSNLKGSEQINAFREKIKSLSQESINRRSYPTYKEIANHLNLAIKEEKEVFL